MGSEQEYCLRWNNHQSTILALLGKLLVSESLTDITLACEGKTLKCHRIVLSACSPYFQEILNSVNDDKHIIVYLKDVSYDELQSLVEYMYKGEVNIVQHKLPSLIKTAENLKIRGLCETEDSKTVEPPLTPPKSESPSFKKRKLDSLNVNSVPTHPMIRIRKFDQAHPPPLQRIDEKNSIDLDDSRLDYKENMVQIPRPEGDFNDSDTEVKSEGEWSDIELNASIGEDILETVRARKGRTSDGQFQCPRCGRRYQHKHTMNRHVRYICGLPPQFQCPLCEKKFHVNYRLKEHLKASHGVESNLATSQGNQSATMSMQSPSTYTLQGSNNIETGVKIPTTTAAISLQPANDTTKLYITDVSSFPSLNVSL
ncbi:hypothetical protein QYM36_017341 [Artemia franciscana]|uniref:Longitudinals lacking protein n=1 Tax=Artemia franciscana TaxID=6661 RepID=A0AA88HD33_ARTSF|nr:hypothetical protein QYM36_017341 [Artemia franciscana]